MRILVTGASGLLGLNLALEAARAGHEVFGVSNSVRLFTPEFTCLQADLLEQNALVRLLDNTRPDWVIHCAALANVDACEANPELAHRLNTEVPALLAKHVARGGARLLHVSTDAVFDGTRGEYSEDDEPNPLSVYARSKLQGEQGVSDADPSAVIARVNLFGWSLTGKRSLGEFFVNNLTGGKQVNGFTDVFFCPLLANDLAHVMLEMLAKNLTGLYHTVSSSCLSKYAFGVAVAEKFGLEKNLIKATSVEAGGLRATRSPHLTLSTGKLSTALGHVLPSVSTGIDRFYALYQQGYPQNIRSLTHPSEHIAGE